MKFAEIAGRVGGHKNVISRRPQDVSAGRPQDDQIGSLGDVLGTLEGDVPGTSWGPIFADWEDTDRLIVSFIKKIFYGFSNMY